MRNVVIATPMMLAGVTTASAHIPSICDPFLDVYVERAVHELQAIEATTKAYNDVADARERGLDDEELERTVNLTVSAQSGATAKSLEALRDVMMCIIG